MPILTLHTVAPLPFRQLAIYTATCSRVQARRRHDAATCDSTLTPDLLPTQSTLSAGTNDYTPLSRSRKHGFKSLPISPLMRDGSARKPRKPVAPQNDILVEEFRKEVATNLYAQALATPIRHCSLTMARLPSHFLLPFVTTVEKPPAVPGAQPPKLKAVIKPGRSDKYAEHTLAQTSYVLNRQDMVRHLARKRHWTILITERQKGKFATMASRSANAQKLVQDHWIWEDQVDATAAMLEEKAVTAVTRAIKAQAQEPTTLAGLHAITLNLGRLDVGRPGGEVQNEGGNHIYELPELLSPESLNSLKAMLGQDSTAKVFLSKGEEACRAQLALERLKTYKDSNDILKALPKVQNPPGSREAREERRAAQLRARQEDAEGDVEEDS